MNGYINLGKLTLTSNRDFHTLLATHLKEISQHSKEIYLPPTVANIFWLKAKFIDGVIRSWSSDHRQGTNECLIARLLKGHLIFKITTSTHLGKQLFYVFSFQGSDCNGQWRCRARLLPGNSSSLSSKHVQGWIQLHKMLLPFQLVHIIHPDTTCYTTAIQLD